MGREDGMVDNKDKMEEFVVLSDIVKDVILEMRYYFTYNFIGDRID